jgi:hypothetical protein
MKKTVTLDNREPYSALRFRVSHINLLIHNLMAHIRMIAHSRNIEPELAKDLNKCVEALDRTKSANSEFNHLIEKLPEVINGSN